MHSVEGGINKDARRRSASVYAGSGTVHADIGASVEAADERGGKHKPCEVGRGQGSGDHVPARADFRREDPG
eukprot:287262-Rhodomonas_salina.2